MFSALREKFVRIVQPALRVNICVIFAHVRVKCISVNSDARRLRSRILGDLSHEEGPGKIQEALLPDRFEHAYLRRLYLDDALALQYNQSRDQFAVVVFDCKSRYLSHTEKQKLQNLNIPEVGQLLTLAS